MATERRRCFLRNVEKVEKQKFEAGNFSWKDESWTKIRVKHNLVADLRNKILNLEGKELVG